LRIAIMGSGGVGGYFGARLVKGGADVHFVARGAHLAAMRERGIGPGEAVMIGDTPMTPRQCPGGVQRRREFCPASFKTGLLRGCREVSRCLASSRTKSPQAGEL
jgi:hypothetical protein